MSEVIPPRPSRPPGRRSLMQLLKLSVGSSLAVFYDASFEVDLGRVSLPTLPSLKRRWLFTVREPALAREVLVGSASAYRKSEIMDYMLRDLTGDSLFVSHGEAWRRQRRLMDPAFATANLKAVFPMMLAACDAAVARLAAHARAQPDRALDVDREMTRFAADVIFRTLFSEAIGAAEAATIFTAFEVFQKVSYVQGILRVVGLPAALVPGARRARRAAREIRAILKAALDRRLAAVRGGLPHPDNDILAVMLRTADPATGDNLGDGELLDQIAILFLAGHETTASALAWSFHLLAICPHMQGRLHDEAVAVRGGRPARHADVKRLAMTRDVFRETLRLYPPVAFFARDAVAPQCLAGRDIAAGAVVVVAPWLLHRHPKHWARPDAFDPDRFSTPEGAEAARCAYLPFSLGERSCVGAAFALQEATLLLTAVTERFRLTPEPGHEPQPVGRLTLRSANGVRVRISER